jgi:uncharacterized membrane protein YkvA (DUF1232 family)
VKIEHQEGPLSERVKLGWRRIRKAVNVLHDRGQTDESVSSAVQKAEQHRGAIANIWEDLNSLVRIVRNWRSGDYREVPWRTLVFSTAAILYFLDPMDVVPDFIPVVGFIDDAAVIAWVMRAIRSDVSKFRDWEESQPDPAN